MTVFISCSCIIEEEWRQVKDNVVAVDLGGTHIRSALINEEGEILARAERETLAHEGPEAVIGRIEACIRDVARGTEAISIAAPGPLDPWKGIVHQAPNLPGWREVPLADILHRDFKVPVHLNNDANLAALGEHRFGAGQGRNDLIYLTISTGIGGGIISQGRLLIGAKGLAGEVGHMTLEPEGPPCGCGGRGHLEALASGTAITRRAVEEIEKGAETSITRLVEGPPTGHPRRRGEQGWRPPFRPRQSHGESPRHALLPRRAKDRPRGPGRRCRPSRSRRLGAARVIAWVVPEGIFL